MAAGLHLLQRNLLIDFWSVRTQRGGHGSHLRTNLRMRPLQIAENAVTD